MSKISNWGPRFSWCLLLATLLAITVSSNAQPIKEVTSISIRAPTEVSDFVIARDGGLSWFIAGVAVAAALNYGTCDKPNGGWLNDLACFASSCILGYSALAAVLKGLNMKKRGLDMDLSPFEMDHHHFGKQFVAMNNDMFNGERHELMNFVLNEHHHTLHFSYNETSQLHTLSSSVKHKSIRKRQVGTGDVEYASDGGVNVDYQWINRDIAEENEIGNMQDVEYKLEEALLVSGVNDEKYAVTGFFCANLQEEGYGDQGLTGAYFVSNGAYPYQPGMADAIVGGC